MTSSATTLAPIWSARPRSVTADDADGADANAAFRGSPPIPVLEAPSRPGRNLTASTSERLAEVLEVVGLPTRHGGSWRRLEQILSLGPRLD
jgi:hypothetical protein